MSGEDFVDLIKWGTAIIIVVAALIAVLGLAVLGVNWINSLPTKNYNDAWGHNQMATQMYELRNDVRDVLTAVAPMESAR